MGINSQKKLVVFFENRNGSFLKMLHYIKFKIILVTPCGEINNFVMLLSCHIQMPTDKCRGLGFGYTGEQIIIVGHETQIKSDFPLI